jgi:hypothetical protein
MKDHLKTEATSIFPRRIRSYLTVNLALAVLMAIVMAVRSELKGGRFLVIDYLLFCFYILTLAVIFFGPLGVVESYLYSQKKGTWYAWKHRTNSRRRDRARNLEERRAWKNEAIRARLFRGDVFHDNSANRQRLFASSTPADATSRPAILMTVAERFEREGKREAAERCYLTITERFADSPQAVEAARRLSSATNA